MLHKTGTTDVDSEGSLEATWTALEKCVADCKVKAPASANFSMPRHRALMKHCTIKPTVNEVELHPLLAQRKLVGVCRRYGLTTVAHTSLANGDERLLKHTPSSSTTDWRVAACRSLAHPLVHATRCPVHHRLHKAARSPRLSQGSHFPIDEQAKAPLGPISKTRPKASVRFHHPSFEFNFDDPFLGGCARPGLDLVPN